MAELRCTRCRAELQQMKGNDEQHAYGNPFRNIETALKSMVYINSRVTALPCGAGGSPVLGKKFSAASSGPEFDSDLSTFKQSESEQQSKPPPPPPLPTPLPSKNKPEQTADQNLFKKTSEHNQNKDSLNSPKKQNQKERPEISVQAVNDAKSKLKSTRPLAKDSKISELSQQKQNSLNIIPTLPAKWCSFDKSAELTDQERYIRDAFKITLQLAAVTTEDKENGSVAVINLSEQITALNKTKIKINQTCEQPSKRKAINQYIDCLLTLIEQVQFTADKAIDVVPLKQSIIKFDIAANNSDRKACARLYLSCLYWAVRQMLQKTKQIKEAYDNEKAAYNKAFQSKTSALRVISTLINEEEDDNSLWNDVVITRKQLKLDCLLSGFSEFFKGMTQEEKIALCQAAINKTNLKNLLENLEFKQIKHWVMEETTTKKIKEEVFSSFYTLLQEELSTQDSIQFIYEITEQNMPMEILCTLEIHDFIQKLENIFTGEQEEQVQYKQLVNLLKSDLIIRPAEAQTAVKQRAIKWLFDNLGVNEDELLSALQI